MLPLVSTPHPQVSRIVGCISAPGWSRWTDGWRSESRPCMGALSRKPSVTSVPCRALSRSVEKVAVDGDTTGNIKLI